MAFLQLNSARLNKSLRVASPFTPARLFTAGEAGAWYDPSDFSTLFQNSLGTTPVTQLGQPVGLVLDKARGGVNNLGPQIVANAADREFTSDTGYWTKTGNTTIGGGIANINTTTFNQGIRVNGTVVLGRTYEVTFTVTRVGAGSIAVAVGNSSVTFNSTGPKRCILTATGFNAFYVWSVVNATDIDITNYSIREVPGTHLIQPTPTSRPTVQARANLLERTEEFDNAYWSKFSVTVTPNTTLAPDNTLTADTLTNVSGAGSPQVLRGVAVAAVQHSWTIWLRAGTSAGGRLGIQQSGFLACTPSVLSGPGTITGSGLTTVGGLSTTEWTRILITFTPAAGTCSPTIYPETSGVGTGKSIIAWGAQLELGPTATPYQRVTTATDYEDIGLPRYLQFDGVDDGLYTAVNLDLSGTNKVTACAGVTKLSDAATATVAETSAIAALNNGAFGLFAPSANNPSYAIAARGSVYQAANIANVAYAAPQTVVESGTADIGGGLVLLRLNGAQVATNTSGMGSGNFASYPLYVGRRNNATSPFNGRIHSLIVRGTLTDALTLSQTERWVGEKTGITLP
jgi:hypothetical protein